MTPLFREYSYSPMKAIKATLSRSGWGSHKRSKTISTCSFAAAIYQIRSELAQPQAHVLPRQVPVRNNRGRNSKKLRGFETALVRRRKRQPPSRLLLAQALLSRLRAHFSEADAGPPLLTHVPPDLRRSKELLLRRQHLLFRRLDYFREVGEDSEVGVIRAQYSSSHPQRDQG